MFARHYLAPVFFASGILGGCATLDSAPVSRNPMIEGIASETIISARTRYESTSSMLAFMRAMEADGTKARVCDILAGRGRAPAPEVQRVLDPARSVPGMSIPRMQRFGGCPRG